MTTPNGGVAVDRDGVMHLSNQIGQLATVLERPPEWDAAGRYKASDPVLGYYQRSGYLGSVLYSLNTYIDWYYQFAPNRLREMEMIMQKGLEQLVDVDVTQGAGMQAMIGIEEVAQKQFPIRPS